MRYFTRKLPLRLRYFANICSIWLRYFTYNYMLLLPYFASSMFFGLRGYEISFLCKSLKNTDMRNGLKSPKNGLKISQLGKYFFATGFFKKK